ncbi:SRPBCC family protein [Streptomyces sp. NPDC059980]|uniref:SRPBCC family protein n=1 Tax=Streptomyces sp. NPDC059980 TaxID=3347022 RepID=UPI0036B4DE9A
MSDYDSTITVDVPPDRLFDYLADVENLPAYMPRLKTASRCDGERVTVTAHIDPADGPEQDVTSEAWIRVLEQGKILVWGAPGPGDYHGQLHVAPGGEEGTSRLTVELHTERVEGAQVDDGLRETLRGIKSAVERTDG